MPTDSAGLPQPRWNCGKKGTPHNGSSIATCGKIIANIVSACSPLNPARTLFGILQKDSKVLFEITEDFVQKTTMLQLVSFFEMEMTSLGPFKKMVVEHHSAILNLPNEVAIGQNSDHRNMARFKSMHDRNFRPVLFRLEKFRRDISKRDALLMHGSLGPQSPRLEGGSGKTQTVIQFAFRNRSKYGSGVIFLNASSHDTLIADFSHLFDVLELEGISNKVHAIKKWLSVEEHSDWLLNFDNVDDLGSVRISNYIPTTSWGHVIITSRDPAVIGSIGKEGCLLERLQANEAVDVLVAKAGLENCSTEDYQQAEAIVEMLGCLPLAVDQGGAYIRSRQKSLKDYRRLYEEQQHEILKYKPRLGEYEKTVLTAWEVNFEQVERDSKEASDLLLLFCFLEASRIPETMLYQGTSPRRRWNDQGEITEVSPTNAGVDGGLIELIRNEIKFDAAVDKLLSFSLIQRNNDLNGSRIFSLHPLVQYSASQRV
ncbi:MAG: hypothetical protein Q9187_004437 [Circinaria calcarea]